MLDLATTCATFAQVNENLCPYARYDKAIIGKTFEASLRKLRRIPRMSNDDYILGINAYDHDVSACLLRNGNIVTAISKERLTRCKHDTGFYDGVVDYCLDVAGIDLNEVQTIVRNSYVMPVDKLEQRLAYRDWRSYLDRTERAIASEHPLYLSNSDRVFDISHHLAHAYSAFAVSPFDDGVIMVVDGVGSYRADVLEPVPPDDCAHSLARESESYYRFRGSNIETLKKVWMEPTPGFLNDEFFMMPGLGALYSRVSRYIFGDWNKCGEVMGLSAYGRSGTMAPLVQLKNGQLDIPEWTAERNSPWLGGGDAAWEQTLHAKAGKIWRGKCKTIPSAYFWSGRDGCTS